MLDTGFLFSSPSRSGVGCRLLGRLFSDLMNPSHPFPTQGAATGGMV